MPTSDDTIFETFRCHPVRVSEWMWLSSSGVLRPTERVMKLSLRRTPRSAESVGARLAPEVCTPDPRFYCMKEDTRVDGPWSDDMDLELLPMTKQMKLFEQWEFRPYQQTLFEQIGRNTSGRGTIPSPDRQKTENN